MLQLVALGRRRVSRGSARLGELILDLIFVFGAMDALLEDRLRLVDIKLRLEVIDIIRNAAAVGAASSVREVEALVNYFLTRATPAG